MVKLLVIGYARHGKDLACEYLSWTYGLKFVSSSRFICEKAVFPVLREKYGYKTVEECFDDRAVHRAEWFDLISEYNTPDKSRLGREILEKYDIYCGLRNAEEWEALKAAKVFDYVLWIDASKRLETKEDTTSNTMLPQMADFIIDNNGSPGDMYEQLDALLEKIAKEGKHKVRHWSA